MRRILKNAALACCLILAAASLALNYRVEAQERAPTYAPQEILIKFKAEATSLQRESIRENAGATTRRSFDSGAQHWQIEPGVTTEEAIESLSRDPLVEYVEPNYYLTFSADPNDPAYQNGSQWALKNTGQTIGGVAGVSDADIDADEAWDISTGIDGSSRVGIVDTGVFSHTDLGNRIWINSAEDDGDGIVEGSNTCPTPNGDYDCVDDDSNGYVDDIRGYNFYNDDPNTNDGFGHGTSVAGIIGALTENGLFGAGVSWNTKMVALKVTDNMGVGTVAGVAEAVDYARNMGIGMLNMSLAIPCPAGVCSQTLSDAISAAWDKEIFVVAAAGNGNVNLDPNCDVSPTCYNLLNIVGVTGTDNTDEWAIGNWGANAVELGAPGKSIYLLNIANGDTFGDGTSYAAPHVTGVATLIKFLNPTMPAEILRKRIIDGVDSNSDLCPACSRPTASGGRLNAYTPLLDFEDTAPSAATGLTASWTGFKTLTLNWTAPGDDGSTGTATMYEIRHSPSTITTGNWLSATRVRSEPVPTASGTSQSKAIGSLSCDVARNFAVRAYDEWGTNGSLATVSKSAAQCQVSYCRSVLERCTWAGNCSTGGCCSYVCVADETCSVEDTCPENACNCPF